MPASRKVKTSLPFPAEEVSQRLLTWYGKEGRDLPWRHTRDPYRIWLSEIMLQQTTVAAVIPYYKRFLERFPTVEALAAASLDDVISFWAGLGYYSRARNLHRAAKKVTEELAGTFPESLQSLMALPGVGRSTAGAILSIAFDQTAPILDGNVRRVLVRLCAWVEDPRSSRAEKQLWEWAELLTPATSVHDYSQAIMDLGATICTPRKPACSDCPLSSLCQAKAKGLVDELPVVRKKTVLPIRRQVAIVVTSEDSILLRQRPAEGFLGGLWELPSLDIDEEVNQDKVAIRLLQDLGLSGRMTCVKDVRHAYSHFKLELKVYKIDVAELPLIGEGSRIKKISLQELVKLPIHGAHKKGLQQLGID